MALRCWLFGHDYGPAIETNLYAELKERTAKCNRCDKLTTVTHTPADEDGFEVNPDE